MQGLPFNMNRNHLIIALGFITVYLLLTGPDPEDEEGGSTQPVEQKSAAPHTIPKYTGPKKLIKMVATPCDKIHLDETMLMLKSAIMTNKRQHNIKQYILTNRTFHADAQRQFDSWPSWAHEGVELVLIHPTIASLPRAALDMMTFGPPCTSVRLAMPELLPEEDAVIYIDADFLFMTPPIYLMEYFEKFSDVQLAGMTPINVEGGKSVVFKANQPYYPPLGCQAGFTLMNLTRMRQNQWTKLYLDIYTEHVKEIFPFDQGLVNWAFHYHPDKLYMIGCEWNIRWFHCDKKLYCQSAINDGVKMVHGHTDAFYDTRRPVFNLVYQKYNEHNLHTETLADLKRKIDAGLQDMHRDEKPCAQQPDMWTKQLDIY